jgi:hypothetical protein
MFKTVGLNHLTIILLTWSFLTILSCKNDNVSEIFIIQDTASIHTIIIQQENKTLKIERNNFGNAWTVNDKYLADKRSIKQLMQTLTSMKIDKNVPAEKTDSVLQAIENEGTTIRISNRKGKTLKVFKTSEYQESDAGTQMMEVENKILYIVNIPGLENNLNNRFNLQYMYWIEPLVFSYKPGEISEIELNYPSTPERSFRLEIKGSEAHLFQTAFNKEITSIDNHKIGNYLSYFMKVKFSDIKVDNQALTDSLKNARPEYIIRVKDKNDKLKTLQCYTIADKNHTSGIDLNKMYALINNEDPVSVTYFDIDLLLKDINYFIK